MSLLYYINTFSRYDSTLPMAISSLLMQTVRPDKFIIFDDNKNPRDLRQTEHYRYLFQLMDQKGIAWEYVWGEKKGAHYSHERANSLGYDYSFFIDDDHLIEPDCVERLMECMKPGVGAVGGLIPMKFPAEPLPAGVTNNRIDDLVTQPNIQWFMWDGAPREVEHIYSSYLSRCGVVHYDLRMSSVSFRCETQYTYGLFLKGFKLLVTPKALTWHLQSTGGIHDGQKQANWDHDNDLFFKWLAFKKTGKRLVVANSGLGDHYMLRQAVPIRPADVVACCYPEAFADSGCKIISIAEAQQLVDIGQYDAYKWAIEHNWKGHMVDAFKEMYRGLV